MYDFYVWVSFFANEYFEMVSAIPAIVWLSSQVWLSRVKSNLEKTSIRVTQVHGSMQAQDVATKVKEIKEEKEKELTREAAKKKKKNDLLEAFNKCRDECNCQQKRCVALGLKVMFYV